MVELSQPASPTAQGPVKEQLRGKVQGCITGLAWAPQAAQLAITSAAGDFILMDFAAGVDWPLQEATAAGGKGFDALGFSSCGSRLAAAGEGGVISLWQLDGDVPEQRPVPPLGDGLINWRGNRMACCWRWHGERRSASCTARLRSGCRRCAFLDLR